MITGTTESGIRAESATTSHTAATGTRGRIRHVRSPGS